MSSPDLYASRLDALQQTFSGNSPYFISLKLSFTAPFDFPRMQNALALLTAAFPVLTARFDADAGGWTYTDSLVEILPFSGDMDESLDCINARPDESAPFFLLSSPDGKTLLLTIDHTVTDAHGLIRIGELLSTAYRSLKTNPAYCIETLTESRSIPLAARMHRFTEQDYLSLCAREVAASELAKPWHTYLTYSAPAEGTYQFHIRRIPPECLVSAKAAAKRLGATVNDLLKAAFAVALQKCIAEKTGERIPFIPLRQANDLRKYLPASARQEIGNFSVPCWASVECPPDENFSAVLRRIGETSRTLKDLPTAPGILFAVEHPGLPLSQALLTGEQISSASLSNVGVISSDSLNFGDDLPVEDAIPYADLRFGNPYYLIASTYAGRLSLAAVTRSAGVEEAERILDETAGILTASAACLKQ
ncbi:MAG: hypothetical protein Q4Q04_07085 [Methanocorpusculum sp.]|nr:hypothetical protein [Methanocorpusculum sp.]